MSLEAALLTARSGLLHTQRALAQSANDVANADVAGYTKKTVPGLAWQADGQGIGVRSLEATRDVDAALVAELDSSRATLAAAEVRVRLLQQVEVAHGRPEAGEGIGDLMGSLRTAFTELRAEPDDAGRRTGALMAAEDLAARLNDVSDAIGKARQEAQDGIVAEVDKINARLREIAGLTRDIQAARAVGSGTAELEDARDRAIGTLSESLEVRASFSIDGGVTLIARGGMVLPLDRDRDVFATSEATVGAGASVGLGTLPPVTLNGQDVTARLGGGRIAEYVALRDSTLPRFQAEADTAAAQLAWRFESEGLRLFTAPDGTVPDATQPYAGSTQIGFAGTIRVADAVRADPLTLRDGTHAVSGGPASDFTPNPAGGPAGFTTLLDRVLTYSFGTTAAAGTSWPAIPGTGLGPDGTLASPFAPPATLEGYGAAVTAAHTNDRAAASALLVQAGTLKDGLEARFAARSGVDVDAEMAAMVQLQNAYAANAKVLGTVQTMWDALFAAVR